ncbi:MAG: S41 family peptidase [bacterium]
MINKLLKMIVLLLLFNSAWALTDPQQKDLPDELPQVNLDDLRTFAEVFAQIKQNYVSDDVDDQQMMTDAIRGLLKSLDPHTTYLPPKEYKSLEDDSSGRFGGVGIEITMQDELIKVVSPMEGTPAKQAGIEPNDLIVQVDDQKIKGLGQQKAVNLMRGEPGSQVTLKIRRKGEKELLSFTLTREYIRVNSVYHEVRPDGIAYIRIASFQSDTGESLVAAIQDLNKKAKQPLQGYILDLRYNPGGVLNAAVSVADSFLTEGRIVTTKGKVEVADMSFDATPVDLIDGKPLVLLVNGGSASASEIVAGALKDHKRAVLVGSTTFGKGSVQSILGLTNGGALKMTTARYYTPSGHSIQAQGIQPDVDLTDLVKEKNEHHAFKEADLEGHLENPDQAVGSGATDGSKKPDEIKDFYLDQATQVLKAMMIARGVAEENPS